MPFKKTGKDRYESPSGREFTEKQVKLYHITGGFKHMDKAKRGKKGMFNA